MIKQVFYNNIELYTGGIRDLLATPDKYKGIEVNNTYWQDMPESNWSVYLINNPDYIPNKGFGGVEVVSDHKEKADAMGLGNLLKAYIDRPHLRQTLKPYIVNIFDRTAD